MPSYTQTSTFNSPALKYNPIPGVLQFIPGVTPPGGDNTHDLIIPMVLQQYSGMSQQGATNIVSVMPIVLANQGGFAYGGTTVTEGATSLTRVSMSGYMDVGYDNPGTTSFLTYLYPGAGTGTSLTWGDLIAMCNEGRVSSGGYQRYDPVWFRDPFGRQFDNVRIIDFQASYVETVPGRTNFSMTLLTL